MTVTSLRADIATGRHARNNAYRSKASMPLTTAVRKVQAASPETTIYLVEEDQATRATIEKTLLKMQYCVDCFEDVSGVLAGYHSSRSGLIIISVYQTELLDMTLARLPAEAGVLIITDKEQMIAAAQSRCCNIRSFLVRPFTAQQLRDAVLCTIEAVSQIAESMRISALAEIDEKQAFAATSEDSFRHLLDMLAAHTDAAYASVLLKDAGDGVYSIRMEKGAPQPAWKRLCERVAKTAGTAAMYSQDDAPPEITAAMFESAVECILSVPLFIRGEMAGIISQIKTMPCDSFKPSDLAYTSLIVRQFGLEMENIVLSQDVKNKQSQVQKLLTEISQAQTNERRRVATEIHDGVAQWLVGAALDISACHQLIGCNQFDDLSDSLLRVKETLQNSIRELRRAIADMRPELLIRLGLVDAITQSAENLKQEGIECSLNIEGDIPKLDPAVENNVYWIVQEILSNIRKHSDADSVNICMQNNNDIFAIMIIDNGCGFDPAAAESFTMNLEHVGIMGMKERAELLGASLIINSAPGNGTSVCLKLPSETKQPEGENDGKNS